MHIKGTLVLWSLCPDAICAHGTESAACMCCHCITGVESQFRVQCDLHADLAPSCPRCCLLGRADSMLSEHGGLSSLTTVANVFISARADRFRRVVVHSEVAFGQLRAPRAPEIPADLMRAVVLEIHGEVVASINTYCNSKHEFLLQPSPSQKEHTAARAYFSMNGSPSTVKDGSPRLDVPGTRWNVMRRHAQSVFDCDPDPVCKVCDLVDFPSFTVEGGGMSLSNRILTVALPVDTCLEMRGSSGEFVGVALASVTATAVNVHGVSRHPYFCVRIALQGGCKPLNSPVVFSTFACKCDGGRKRFDEDAGVVLGLQVQPSSDCVHFSFTNPRLERLHEARTPTALLENLGWPMYIHTTLLRNQEPPFPVKGAFGAQSPEPSHDFDLASALLGPDVVSLLVLLLSEPTLQAMLPQLCANANSKASYLDCMFALQLSLMPAFSQMFNDAVDLLLCLCAEIVDADAVDCMRRKNDQYCRDQFQGVKSSMYTLSREIRAVVFSEIVAEVGSNIFLDSLQTPMNLFFADFNVRPEILKLRVNYDNKLMRHDLILFIQSCGKHAHRPKFMPSAAEYMNAMTDFNARFSLFLREASKGSKKRRLQICGSQ